MTLRSNQDSGQAALLERARGFVAEEVELHAARIDREGLLLGDARLAAATGAVAESIYPFGVEAVEALPYGLR